MTYRLIFLSSCFLFVSMSCVADTDADMTQFIQNLQQQYALNPIYSQQVLGQAKVKKSILRAMSRQGESKPWHKYRKIFITKSRINGGVKFWKKYANTLAKAEQIYGIPAEIIVAIIGVETAYGNITGKYRVVDALYTLAFHYPKRADFFKKELGEFLLLAREENLPPLAINGSYAGAMGMGQFMPSSYRKYAVDFNNDGTKRLWQTIDTIGSVANYFKQHGWIQGQAVIHPITPSLDEIKMLEALDNKPEKTLYQLQQLGINIPSTLPKHYRASLISLKQLKTTDHYLGFDNFYVITRYNHSHRYAMAVYQLAMAIKAKKK